MNKKNPAYWFVYITFFMVVVTTAFFDKLHLLYVKPIASFSVILLYIKCVPKINPLFPVCIGALMVCNTFITLGFLKYIEIITVLASLFLILCVLQVKKFISFKNLFVGQLFSLPVLLSCILVFYLTYSVTQLTLPVVGNSFGFIVLVMLNLLVYSGFCLLIYIIDSYEKTIYLFVSASSTIIVVLSIAINELYYFGTSFTVFSNMFEIVGLYFFTSFFIETKKKKMSNDELYF